MKKPFYPDVEITENKYAWEARTILRREKNGVWYDINHKVAIYKEEGETLSCKDKIETINRLHIKVYHFIILGEVDEYATDLFQQKMYPVSDIKINEEERLIETLKVK